MTVGPDTADPVPAWAGDGELRLDAGLVARIVRLNMLVTSALERLVEPHGITVADYLVLATVRRAPGGRTAPSTICRVLGRTSGGMSLALDRLTAAGWTRRLPDPADRRRVIVELTGTGRAVATEVNDALHAWEDGLGAGPDRRAYEESLDGLIALVGGGDIPSQI